MSACEKGRGKKMKRKQVLAFFMALCMMCGQTVWAENGTPMQQEEQTEFADAETVLEEIPTVGDEKKIIKKPQNGALVKDAPEEMERAFETEKQDAGTRVVGQTGKSIPLSSEAIAYDSYWVSDACEQIPCDELGGIYFLNRSKLSFYSPETDTLEEICEFDDYYMVDVYTANDRLYILGYDSKVTVYNLLTRKEEQNFTFSNNASAIGADSEGRIYLAGEEEEKYKIYLLSASGEELSQTVSEEKVYSFGGFDSSNGNFYLESYDSWEYWGYDHDMHAVRAGVVKGNTISFDETILMYACQSYFYERRNQMNMLGDKYLCIDSTLFSGLSLWDSDKYNPESPADTEVLFLQRDNKENGAFDRWASIGTRAVYREETDSVVCFKNNNEIAEYDIKTGKELFSAKTDYPVFNLMEYDGGIAAIEKSGGNYYYEYFPWKMAETVEIQGDSSVDIGQTLQLTASTDGSVEEHYTWSSSDTKTASVNRFGQVFGWSEGDAVITVETGLGLKAEYPVHVTGNCAVETPDRQSISTSGTASSNYLANDYQVWASTMKSYFTQNADGTFTRMEYSNKEVIAEMYSADGKKTGSKKITMELSLFGGFYSGEDYNYFVFGQENPEESDEKEVMRVVRYSKDYQRIDAVSIYGANTFIPFEAGSLRMTETEGRLYIHTCHTMYSDSDDGVHHQANMTFVINEEEMSVEQSFYDVMNLAQAGYVSHSFNQFIQTDGEEVYRVDHGDAYPRGIAITKCKVGEDITNISYAIPLSVGGPIGYNITGFSIGGFELASERCIIAGNAVDLTQENLNFSGRRNIFLNVTNKNLTSGKMVRLTDYDGTEDFRVSTPQLVKIGEDQFLVMWEETKDYGSESCVKMVTVDSEGNKTSNVVKKTMKLSDCQPIVCGDGLVRWYATQNSSPVIYVVNPFDLSGKIMSGDANLDSAVDMEDLRLVLRAVCKKTTLNEQQEKAADVTGDGTVNLDDIRRLLQFVCGKITEL